MEQAGFAALLFKPVRQEQLACHHGAACGRSVAAATPPDSAPAKLAPAPHNARRARILVAEDNRVNQLFVLTFLKKQGYHADAVANGAEAIVALQQLPYDLVLMDCQMPEMDGYEATRHIRTPASGVRNSSIPVVAMTANAMQGDRELCLAAGMDDYVTKPVRPDALIAALDRWLVTGDG